MKCAFLKVAVFMQRLPGKNIPDIYVWCQNLSRWANTLQPGFPSFPQNSLGVQLYFFFFLRKGKIVTS